MIWIFLLGALLGASIGVVAVSLCVIAKQSDERAERMLKMLNRSNGDEL
ncbi:MAG: DUF3789 domain-containing protein [Veillonella caviae]|nr:DUF3789 domain-containing protein [Veillonella caviae]MDY5715623.1 DUF3789 domain-containing protein [Veillonella caviae]